MDIIELTSEKIDVGGVLSRVVDPSSGGIACFLGTTRDSFEGKRVLCLEYETYRSMALKELRRVAQAMRQRWPLTKVALVHRTGPVPVTEVGVLVAASAVHRKEALEATGYGIDAIKSQVPIWKKESYDDGTCSWKENCKKATEAILQSATEHVTYREDPLSDGGSRQVLNSSTGDEKPQVRTRMLVRLQAAVQTPTPADPSTHSARENSCVSGSDVSGQAALSDGPGRSAEPEVGSEQSPLAGGISAEIQRFLTSDGQCVYGYKDADDNFHLLCTPPNDRETHNEKERKRRSRVTDACARLREMVPGVTDKTDKATVFEQTARYLQFLREKYGTKYDQAYYEKHFAEKGGEVSYVKDKFDGL